jgi:hypothetical protein
VNPRVLGGEGFEGDAVAEGLELGDGPLTLRVAPRRPAGMPDYVNTFTALATTRARMAREIIDRTAMVILAHGTRGMASVG